VIVVDTSVWIDYFAGRSDRVHVAALVDLVERDAVIALTDVILTEILQGLGDERSVRTVEARFEPFEVRRLEALDDFRAAAALYRNARRRGRTIRKTLDCLIAAVCIREGAAILHNDRDFDQLSEVSDLQVYPVGESTIG